jgi:hypothetical protein
MWNSNLLSTEYTVFNMLSARWHILQCVIARPEVARFDRHLQMGTRYPDFLLRSSHPQGVFALEGSERLNCVGATDRLHSCFGKAEVLDIFDRHVRVNTVLIKQADNINLEPLERALYGLLDVLWPAVQPRHALHPTGIEIRTDVEPEFGSDHHLLTEGHEGFAHRLFGSQSFLARIAETRWNLSRTTTSYGSQGRSASVLS